MIKKFHNKCNDELNNHIMKYSLHTDYVALLCDKTYYGELIKIFRTKWDILMKMIKRCV